MATTSIAAPGVKHKAGPTIEQAALLYGYVTEGYTYAQAYRKVFPKRKCSDTAASTQGGLIFKEYRDNYADDRREAARRHGIDADRWYRKADKLLEAKTLDELVKTEVLEGDNGKARTVVTRNSVEVDDNGTQLGTLRLVGQAIGILSEDETGKIQNNIAVVVVSTPIRKQRQRRLVEEGA